MNERQNTNANLFRVYQAFLVGVVALAALLGSHAAKANESTTIGIMSGGVSGTYVQIAQNMSDFFESDDLRIITMLGKGSQQNIRDLIELDGVDLAIVQSDVLANVALTNEIPGANSSIRYITKLYNEEVHILTTTAVRDVRSLEGANVAVGRKGSGSEMTADILFRAIGVNINPINVAGQAAVDALEQGLVSAAVFVVGKPSSLLQSIEASSGLKLLEITPPTSVSFPYFPTELSREDYPNLIKTRKPVPTVAVGAILAVFNWREGSKRYETLASFTKNLMDSIDLLKSGSYHPKWAEVDPTVSVPGWTRFKPAMR